VVCECLPILLTSLKPDAPHPPLVLYPPSWADAGQLVRGKIANLEGGLKTKTLKSPPTHT